MDKAKYWKWALLFFWIPFLWAVDELVVVQAVSVTGKTFVIRRGVADGIERHQESIFTNSGASLYAVAVDVNRHYSLWKVRDERGKASFTKGDRIMFAPAVNDLWSNLPRFAQDRERLYFQAYDSWVLRFHYGLSLGESISSIEGGRYRERQGIQLEGVYAKRFRTNMDWRAGLRWDREVTRLFSPTIDSVTYRYLMVGEINYYLAGTETDVEHYYVGTGGGWGVCSTQTQNVTQWGTCLSFPMIRLGYEYRRSTYAFLWEVSVDSLYSRESIPGNRGRQTLNVINSRLTFGIKF